MTLFCFIRQVVTSCNTDAMAIEATIPEFSDKFTARPSSRLSASSAGSEESQVAANEHEVCYIIFSEIFTFIGSMLTVTVIISGDRNR